MGREKKRKIKRKIKQGTEEDPEVIMLFPKVFLKCEMFSAVESPSTYVRYGFNFVNARDFFVLITF